MRQTSLLTPIARPLINRFADATPRTRCDICRSEHFTDRRIHDGASLIRECATCRRFLCFPLWNGQAISA